MAVVKMTHIRLIGLDSEKDLILDALSRTKNLDITVSDDDIDDGEREKRPENPMGLDRRSDSARLEKIRAQIMRVDSAIEEIQNRNASYGKLLKTAAKQTGDASIADVGFDAEKKPLFFYKRKVDVTDLDAVSELENELLARLSRLEDRAARISEIDAAVAKNASRILALTPYSGMDMPFSEIRDTKNVAFLLGSVSKEKLEEFDAALAGFTEVCELIKIPGESNDVCCFVAVSKPEREAVAAALTGAGFSKCVFDYDRTAEAQSDFFAIQNEKLEEEKRALVGKIATKTMLKRQLELYYDYLNLELEKVAALDQCGYTKRTFLLEGWLPAAAQDVVQNAVAKVSPTAVIEFRAPEQDETPPTYLTNNKFAGNYENITNMYSVPAYREIDPNFLMSVFFFVFYGIMLGDAGYGLILSVATLVLILTVKMTKATKKMMWVLFFGGLSAIVWGLVFGSVFAIEGIPKLLDPLTNPMLLLGICLGLGFIQVLVGLGMKAANLIRQKKIWSALFDVGFLYLLFIGIGMLVIGNMAGQAVVTYIGLGLAVAAVIGMIATQGRHKPTVGGKLSSGFGSLYNLINYISDILSYSRLFCLGIVGGAIGMVVNKIAMVLISMLGIIGGIIPAVVVILAFHIFNLALSCLSAYVHNIRLQFVEYYGKFYEGNGREFLPLGLNTRYIEY